MKTKEKLHQLRELLATPMGHRAIIISVLLAFIIVIVIISLSRSQTINIVTEELDLASGETLRHIDQYPEIPQDRVNIVGFVIFSRVGFTAQQQEIIWTTIQDFFTENFFPDIQRVSYRQGSIEYDENNVDYTYFELVSDTNETFRVRIDSDGSMLRAIISIYDSHGKQLY